MSKFDVLFTCQDTRDWLQGDIEKIAIMSGRLCDTGFMAFGYPYLEDKCYPNGGTVEGVFKHHSMYSTQLVISEDEIPALIEAIKQHGFTLAKMSETEVDDEGNEGGDLVYLNEQGHARETGSFWLDGTRAE